MSPIECVHPLSKRNSTYIVFGGRSWLLGGLLHWFLPLSPVADANARADVLIPVAMPSPTPNPWSSPPTRTRERAIAAVTWRRFCPDAFAHSDSRSRASSPSSEDDSAGMGMRSVRATCAAAFVLLLLLARAFTSLFIVACISSCVTPILSFGTSCSPAALASTMAAADSASFFFFAAFWRLRLSALFCFFEVTWA